MGSAAATVGSWRERVGLTMFSPHDLNVHLKPAFLNELDAALQSGTPKLVLVYATNGQYELTAARDYLRRLTQKLQLAPGRHVLSLRPGAPATELAGHIIMCPPGSLVFLDELRPSGELCDSPKTAARFVQLGAIVVATIHAPTPEAAKTRLGSVWAADMANAAGRGLEELSVQFIAFDASVQAVKI
jgi:hypothetical protein